MWPWGHLAVGYLCYVGFLNFGDNNDQNPVALLAVGFGTQVPDLVDKPLAWTFAVLPSGRSFAHSLLIAVVVIGALGYIGKRRQQISVVLAFSIGYLSHLISDLGPDVLWGLFQGDWSQLRWTTYLIWPVVSPPPYPHDSSFGDHIMAFSFDLYMTTQILLFGIAISIWFKSGSPGLNELSRMCKRQISKVIRKR